MSLSGCHLLVAGGWFTTTGSVAANSIAKWSGTKWSTLGAGVGGAPAWVMALAVYDDGTGPALYAAGWFTSAGGQPANNIAKWDGASWSALGSGLTGPPDTRVLALAVFDDGLVTRRVAPMPDPGIWHGREGMLTVLGEWIETFDEFTMRGEEFIDAGDYIVVRVAQEGRGDGSGVPVKATFWFVLGLRDRKVAEFDMYATREQALEAVGLLE